MGVADVGGADVGGALVGGVVAGVDAGVVAGAVHAAITSDSTIRLLAASQRILFLISSSYFTFRPFGFFCLILP